MSFVQKITIRTHVVTTDDDVVEVVKKYVSPRLEGGDVVLVTSKIVSVAQGRIRRFDDIKVGFWANLLWRFVSKPQYGIGAIGLPEKMQAAIDLVGLPRILLGAFLAAIGRPFGVRGIFYRIVGHGVAEIDGSRILTFDSLIRTVILGPERGDEVAGEIKEALGGYEVAIIDAGDYGNVDVLGKSSGINEGWVIENCRDNPLGQTMEQTPVGILRVLKGDPPAEVVAEAEEKARVKAEALAELKAQKERGEA
ncbi:MAG: F420-0--gamma-glutamyl ligase [bacterium]|nr:F420-0--gamma-glutamyl ligase [bacterium]